MRSFLLLVAVTTVLSSLLLPLLLVQPSQPLYAVPPYPPLTPSQALVGPPGGTWTGAWRYLHPEDMAAPRPGQYPLIYYNRGVTPGGPATVYGLIDVAGTGFPPGLVQIPAPNSILPAPGQVTLTAAWNGQRYLSNGRNSPVINGLPNKYYVTPNYICGFMGYMVNVPLPPKPPF